MTSNVRAAMYGPQPEEEKLEEWPLTGKTSLLTGDDVVVDVQGKNYVKVTKGNKTFVLSTGAYAMELEKKVKDMERIMKRMEAQTNRLAHNVAILTNAFKEVSAQLKNKVDKF